jgi:hypothetical protein
MIVGSPDCVKPVQGARGDVIHERMVVARPNFVQVRLTPAACREPGPPGGSVDLVRTTRWYGDILGRAVRRFGAHTVLEHAAPVGLEIGRAVELFSAVRRPPKGCRPPRAAPRAVRLWGERLTPSIRGHLIPRHH